MNDLELKQMIQSILSEVMAEEDITSTSAVKEENKQDNIKQPDEPVAVESI